MREKIEAKIHAIADALFFNMKLGKLDLSDCGLLSGRMGIIIFCMHYLRAYPNIQKSDLLSRYTDAYFERLSVGMDYYPYCGGLTGILEGLNYLANQQLLDIDYSELEINYKKALQQFSLHGILNKNYDYLHGGLGVVKYFSNDADFVNQTLEALNQTAEKDESKYKWLSLIDPEQNLHGYNISLSHGSSSIVSVLSTLTSPEIDHNKRDIILNNACNYILAQEIENSKFGCFFPSFTSKTTLGQQQERSRLAWCYGDLGIATSIWQAGCSLKKQSFKNKAIEVFTYSATRKSLSDSLAYDAGLCHGAASICMMFNYMYQQSRNNLFLKTRDYWLEQTLRMASFTDGPAGFKSWYGPKKGWKDSYELIDGISGIGLLFLSVINSDMEDADWTQFFLLSSKI